MHDSAAKEHKELLDVLVPLCGGLPLALTVTGNIFLDQARRDRAEWKLIQKQLTGLDADNEDTSPVTKSLQLSYDRLAPSRQKAFLDVVNMFYGWPWETVERNLGVLVMRDLKNSTLILQANSIDQCNQSALRRGYDSDWWYGTSTVGEYDKKVVSMHDLTLRFGLSIHADTQYMEGVWDDEIPRALTLRHLILERNVLHQATFELILNARNLQMLIVNSLGQAFAKTLRQEGLDLHYIKLLGCNYSRLIMEMKVSREIRDITLGNCDDIVELPPRTPLVHLERLQICNCPNFQGFSESCVGGWHNLKELVLDSCPKITSIPAELGSIPNLRSVFVGWCNMVREFPSLKSPRGLSTLVLKHCPELETLPIISCPVRFLQLEGLPIQRLEMEDVTSLTHLIVISCISLHALPSTLDNASSLIKLDVSGSVNLQKLPLTIIRDSTALQCLQFQDCYNITSYIDEELQEEAGFSASLKELHISFKVPKAVINAVALRLQVLHISRYETAVLDLSEAMAGNLVCLRELVIRDCKEMEEIKLPESVGRKWTCLREFSVVSCGRMKELPEAMCSVCSLERLEVRDCASLVELPKQIGGLHNLTGLSVMGCRRLKKLPTSITHAHSLVELSLMHCESLEKLPKQLSMIESLRSFHVSGCKALKKLPDIHLDHHVNGYNPQPQDAVSFCCCAFGHGPPRRLTSFMRSYPSL